MILGCVSIRIKTPAARLLCASNITQSVNKTKCVNPSVFLIHCFNMPIQYYTTYFNGGITNNFHMKNYDFFLTNA